MINRPLPTLPQSEEKKQRKASKGKRSSEPSRRSFILNSKSEDSGASSPVELRNGQHLTTLRPPSVQYQNESLHQNPLDVAGVYAGPLTPKK